MTDILPTSPRRALSRDTSGVTAVEFALIAPALLTVLLGLMDLSYNIYTKTVLEGVIQKAGRDATLEGADSRGLAIDGRVRDAVRDVVPNATVAFERRAYVDYSDVGRPEHFNDVDGNGICSDGESFEDVNRNGRWDRDQAQADMGGARDAVVYTVSVTYPRAFPLAGLLGFDDTVRTESRTVLRNQPYSQQDTTSGVGQCT